MGWGGVLAVPKRGGSSPLSTSTFAIRLFAKVLPSSGVAGCQNNQNPACSSGGESHFLNCCPVEGQWEGARENQAGKPQGKAKRGAGTWGVIDTFSLFVTIELGAEGKKKKPIVGSYKKQRGRR